MDRWLRFSICLFVRFLGLCPSFCLFVCFFCEWSFPSISSFFNMFLSIFVCLSVTQLVCLSFCSQLFAIRLFFWWFVTEYTFFCSSYSVKLLIICWLIYFMPVCIFVSMFVCMFVCICVSSMFVYLTVVICYKICYRFSTKSFSIIKHHETNYIK